MKNDRKYLICKHCKNIVGMIKDAGVTPVCCGEPMTVLAPNTEDAATEKHVPAIQRDGEKLIVNIGSVEHPMTPEHYIEWITVAQGTRTQRVALTPDNKPTAEFCIDSKEPATVYAYCNLHGLWAAEA